MAQLVTNCPRCDAQKITFDAYQHNYRGRAYDWQTRFELFCVCQACHKATIFLVTLRRPHTGEDGPGAMSGVVNDLFDVEGHISLKDEATVDPPEHLPAEIEAAFREGATCLAVQCYNAAGTMFRLCVDLATRERLPAEGTEGISAKERRDLGLRLPWLFDHGKLPEDLRELSTCIKDDGNDGAHQGTLTKVEAEDLLDFSIALLDRLYTEPERLKLAKARRAERRTPK